MNEIKLIGLSGQLQNGKDTVADLICKLTSEYDVQIGEQLISWKTRRFAGILKQMTALLIGCEVSDLERDDFKNKPLGEEWRRWYFIDKNSERRISPYFASIDDAKVYLSDNEYLSHSPSYDLPKLELIYSQLRDEILTPRLILQLLGTEGGRDVIHPNIWVNATLGKLRDDEKYIITDCRFPNEVVGIKKRKGIVVRVVRPSKISTSTHPSEISLNDYKDWDYVIVNDGNLEDLEEKVIDMLEYFNIPLFTQIK